MLCDRCHERETSDTIVHVDGRPDGHYCPECASVIFGTPRAAHRFASLFATNGVLRITFRDGDIFRLRDFSVVNPTIYGDADRWTSTVVEAVHGKHPDFARLHRPGGGLDFNERDISEIFDESSSTSLFQATQVA
ncbi:MAG TPA: hypothetical protein VGQ95_09070 [Chthoniobacterales bacterium]|nr:hypothetical protein [Chthoniobacterales bacterium]